MASSQANVRRDGCYLEDAIFALAHGKGRNAKASAEGLTGGESAIPIKIGEETMELKLQFDLNESVKIKATQTSGKVIAVFQSYNHKEPLYSVEYVTTSTNELVDRYFLADELESVIPF